jgi:hypothetical protein
MTTIASTHKTLGKKLKPYTISLETAHKGLSPIAEWSPDDNHTVRYWLDVEIQFEGEPAPQWFGVWILTEDSQRHFNLKRGNTPRFCLVVLGEYEWQKVVELVQSTVESCGAASSLDFCNALKRHFQWDDWGQRQYRPPAKE